MKAKRTTDPLLHRFYVDRLRNNLRLITDVARRADVEIIMAFKANALWRTFPIVLEYIDGATASSVNELRLARDGGFRHIHSYTPAYTDANINDFIAGSSHITFNSQGQLRCAFGPKTAAAGVSVGLRVNPKCSVIDTGHLQPRHPRLTFRCRCRRLACPRTANLGRGPAFPRSLCESDAADLEKVLLRPSKRNSGQWLPQLKWVNFGGGHLMTREGYDTEHLVGILRGFKERHPNLHVILEPGSAFTFGRPATS